MSLTIGVITKMISMAMEEVEEGTNAKFVKKWVSLHVGFVSRNFVSPVQNSCNTRPPTHTTTLKLGSIWSKFSIYST